jgi:hypothetical protein
VQPHMKAGLAITVMQLIATPAFSHPENASMDSSLEKKCPSAETWYQNEANRREKNNITQRAPTDTVLHDELIAMTKRDESARTSLLAATEQNRDKMIKIATDVDKENLSRLKPIVAHNGFPTENQVGHDGIQAAMLLVQHADIDPEFQKQVLKVLRRRVGKDIPPDTYAMLDDRINIREGKPQHYGSQFHLNNGDLTLSQPSDSLDSISINRSRVGLMPLNDYICILKAMEKNNY